MRPDEGAWYMCYRLTDKYLNFAFICPAPHREIYPDYKSRTLFVVESFDLGTCG